MKQSKIKLTNYHELATTDQYPSENPQPFLNDLGKILLNTNVNPGSLKGELMLKDWFITSPPQTSGEKLQKQAVRPNIWLGELLRIATPILYTWDQKEKEKAKERERKRRKTKGSGDGLNQTLQV